MILECANILYFKHISGVKQKIPKVGDMAPKSIDFTDGIPLARRGKANKKALDKAYSTFLKSRTNDMSSQQPVERVAGGCSKSPRCKAGKACPAKAGVQSHNEAYTVNLRDAAIWAAGKQGDCHASLATSAADGTFSTASSRRGEYGQQPCRKERAGSPQAGSTRPGSSGFVLGESLRS